MRTAVVRVQVDPAGRLTPEQLTDGMTALRGLGDAAGIAVSSTTTSRRCRPGVEKSRC